MTKFNKHLLASCNVIIIMMMCTCEAIWFTPKIEIANQMVSALHRLRDNTTPEEAIFIRTRIGPCIRKLMQDFSPEIIDSALRRAENIADDCSPGNKHLTKQELIRVGTCYEETGKVLGALYNCIQDAKSQANFKKAKLD